MQHSVLFDRQTEMAWYVLNQFINPLDCSVKYLGAALPMNLNLDLERVFNHEADEDGSFCRPHYFSKLRLHSHLNGGETYYYRCRYNAVARIGYGSYEAAKDKLTFAEVLGINGKVQKFPQTGVMLLCADIDAHHGEQDAAKVRDLLLDILPESYWEPSTNGKGIHLYFKLAFPREFAGNAYETVQYVHRIMGDFGRLLNRRCEELGYDAPVDGVRGLPSLIGCSSTGRITIKTRSQCIKIPRFSEGEPAILKLYRAPYIAFTAIDELVKRQKAADLTEPLLSDMAVSKALRDLFVRVPETFITEDIEKGGEAIYSNSVVSRGYDHILPLLRRETDAYARSLRFAFAFTRHRREIPSVEEFLAEYEAQQLNTLADEDGNRRKRFEFFHAYIAGTFDPKCLGFGYDGFEKAQPSIETFLRQRLTPAVKLSYLHKKSYPIALEELARALYAMLHSQGTDTETAFSIRQMRNAFKEMKGKGIGKPKACAIFRILQEIQLIQRVGGYVPSFRGWVWRVETIPESISTAA